MLGILKKKLSTEQKDTPKIEKKLQIIYLIKD